MQPANDNMGPSSIFGKPYFPYLLLAVLSIPLYFLNVNDTHPWGDDFSQYIKEAQNIAQGKPFNETTWIFNATNPVYAPPQYPPGFPLMIAPVVKMFGISIRALEYFNSFIVMCLLFALYKFFRNYAGKVASVCLSVLIGYSAYMLDIKGNILADVPCLLFIILYLAFSEDKSAGKYRVPLLIFFATFAMQARSPAIILLLAEGGYWVIDGLKYWVKSKTLPFRYLMNSPSMYIIVGSLLFNLFLNKVIFPTSISTNGYYKNIYDAAIQNGILHDPAKFFDYAAAGINSFLHYNTEHAISEKLIGWIIKGVTWAGILGFFIKVARNFGVSDFVFLGACMVAWHFPYQDVRYLLPGFPMFILYAYFAVRTAFSYILRINTAIVATGCAVSFLLLGSGHLIKAATYTPSGMVPDKREWGAFTYIKKNVKDDEIILFTKPRLLALYTEKKTINTSWQLSLQDNKRVFDSLKVRYVLTLTGLDDGYFKDYLHQVQNPIDSTEIGSGYTIYKLW